VRFADFFLGRGLDFEAQLENFLLTALVTGRLPAIWATQPDLACMSDTKGSAQV
jgi:hypothetical protein